MWSLFAVHKLLIRNKDALGKSRIVGGSDSRPDMLPWQLFVKILRDLHCGGVLLNRRFGLSAMHCFWKRVPFENLGKVSPGRGEGLSYEIQDSDDDRLTSTPPTLSRQS